MMATRKKRVDMKIQGQKREPNKWPEVAVIILQNKMAFFITLILVLFAGFREIGFDRDSLNYATEIQSINFLSFPDLNFFNKEPTFYLIAYAAHWLFGDAVRGTLLIYALLGVTIKMIGIYRLSRIPLLSVVFYASYYYPLHELTQIRSGVASAIFLLAIPDIANRNLKAYMTKTILAILFHYSAILMLLLYPILNIKYPKLNIKIKNSFYFILPILGLFLSFANKAVLDFIIANIFILNFIPSFLSHRVLFYLNLFQRDIFNEINIFNLYYLSLLGIYYFCLINLWRFKSNIDIILIKILGLSLFSFSAFSFLPVFAFRIFEFLGIVIMILLASIVYIFKQRVLLILFILIYSLMLLINVLFIHSLFTIWRG
jgi:hypothetical protein